MFKCIRFVVVVGGVGVFCLLWCVCQCVCVCVSVCACMCTVHVLQCTQFSTMLFPSCMTSRDMENYMLICIVTDCVIIVSGQ